MSRVLKTFFIYASIVVFVVGVIGGGVYLYRSNTTQNQTFDSIIQASGNAVQQQTGGQANSTNEAGLSSVNIKSDIDALRSKINTMLANWKNSESANDIATMQSYVARLRSILDALGPNSGLSQREIVDIQKSISSAENAINNSGGSSYSYGSGNSGSSGTGSSSGGSPGSSGTSDNFGGSGYGNSNGSGSTGSSGNSSGSGSSGSSGSSGNNGSSGSGSSGMDPFITPSNPSTSPTPPPDTSGKPKLIEGANIY